MVGRDLADPAGPEGPRVGRKESSVPFQSRVAGGGIGGAELTSALEASLSVVDCRKAGTGWGNCPETS